MTGERDIHAHSPWVVQTTRETFEADVIGRSHQVPVVVDFWAEWCAPCRVLGPVLEKLTVEFDGQFVLVKANTEQVPEFAASFNVQGIPAVFALRDGAVINYFAGAMPEAQLRTWLASILPSEAEQLTTQGNLQVADEPEAAEASFRSAMEKDPNLAAPRVALAELLLQQQRNEECVELVEQLERRGFLEPQAERVKAALQRRREGDSVGDIDECRAALADDPENLELKLALGEALAASAHYDEALQAGLEVVQRDRGELREKARQLMVDIFRLLPDESELTSTYRRKLSSALY